MRGWEVAAMEIRNPNIGRSVRFGPTRNKFKIHKYKTWIQPLSATLGFEDFRRGFKSEAFFRTFIEPVFDLC